MSKPVVQVSPDEMYTLLLCSVRYALGRQTYIVGDVCSLVRQFASTLKPSERWVIARDVSEFLKREDSVSLIDKPEWERLARHLGATK